ncbi:hypothetical protein SAGEFAYGE_223 [Bacillus phage SageFayge]|uniref:Uncharacterized protein n=1 Tax=Bacillus phage SageFayge TaxID=1805954 RepID=A0A143FPN0_9CAUD|nr:hypothetical protein SAGEFAYGE_223 [Bacillus phage SageFayge]AMW63143.1 hypothetical protein SAGEFAYGE_223 [Bacillus phage SageFayge]
MSYAELILEKELERLAFLIAQRKRWLSTNVEGHPHVSSVKQGIMCDEMNIQDLEAALNIMRGAR